jgi:hypothetical protein
VNQRATTQPQKIASSSGTSSRAVLLQRKRAYGSSTDLAGQFAERSPGLIVQHRHAGHAEQSSVPPIVEEVLSSPGDPLDADTRNLMGVDLRKGRAQRLSRI